jgi:hypothetical protein
VEDSPLYPRWLRFSSISIEPLWVSALDNYLLGINMPLWSEMIAPSCDGTGPMHEGKTTDEKTGKKISELPECPVAWTNKLKAA